MAIDADNVALARAYLAALEGMPCGEALAAFYDPEVVQEEFPNRISPQGATRDLAALLEGAERGRKLMASQRYEVLNALGVGSLVVVELVWTGTLAVSLGSLSVGDQMRARCAMVLEFHNGKIRRQRSYDCFHPGPTPRRPPHRRPARHRTGGRRRTDGG